MNNKNLAGPRYWKSLDDLAETPAFREWMEREFPSGASELDGVNRRQFMKVMAASFGLAGLGMSGCRRPEQTILPYAKQPENVIPGVPVYYSSSMPGVRENIPLIVETHTGRPTKLEGNPSYKAYGGATTVYAQASILNLYDPDRATKSREGEGTITRDIVRDRLSELSVAHTKDMGEGLVFLAEPSTSPSRKALADAIKLKYPKATWTEYSAIDESSAEAATVSVLGKPIRAIPQFDKVKRVLAIDADFVSSVSGHLGYARSFAKSRKVSSTKDASSMSRLYSVESLLTATGSTADHRLRLSSSQMVGFTAQIGSNILKARNVGGSLVKRLDELGASISVDPEWVKQCSADLVEHVGNSLVLAGDHLPDAVHHIVLAINTALNAPINYLNVPSKESGIEVAVERLNKGGVDTLVLLGGNPVYNAPIDLNWENAQSKAKKTLFLSDAKNETAASADLFMAQSHYLESWGDGRAYDGVLLPVQPMIEPLFPTVNELEVLALLLGSQTSDAYKITQDTFRQLGGRDFNKFLSDGLLEDSSYEVVPIEVDYAVIFDVLNSDKFSAEKELSSDNLEVRFTPSSHGMDGRFANNGWMLECPDPITKLTWDNPILISPRLAKDLEARDGVQIFPKKTVLNGATFEAAKGTLQRNKAIFDRGKEMAVVAELTINGRSIEAPIHVLPGLANYTIQLPLGLGRKVVGRVGYGVGFDFYRLRESSNMGYANNAAIKLTKKTYRLANTQEHWSMEGRAIVREANADYYTKHPDFANKVGVESHAPANYGKYDYKSLQKKSLNNYRGNSAYEHPKFNEPYPNVKVWKNNQDKFPQIQQWGMALDANSCFGCSACVVACQSENNIPIVGKDQVLRGREMHWMRIDRYFSAAKYDQAEIPEDVQVSFMGVACQHCENAPCESVCPVNATVHDKQGLNTMAYNRCVGTRYCANNCPFKVRRFNFFDWNKRQVGEFYKGPLGKVDEPELQKMQKNPNVTVRMRGVMEKCTYCVQRIESAKIDQKRRAGPSGDIHVKDGAIKTACQQVCPTDAISFGDISDPNSEVSKMKASDRNYSLLGYLNVRARTTYLARLRNPNKKMPDYYDKPFAYAQYDERYGHGSSGDKHSSAEHNKHSLLDNSHGSGKDHVSDATHTSHDHHAPMAGDVANH